LSGNSDNNFGFDDLRNVLLHDVFSYHPFLGIHPVNDDDLKDYQIVLTNLDAIITGSFVSRGMPNFESVAVISRSCNSGMDDILKASTTIPGIRS
jgi:hypothetical protein